MLRSLLAAALGLSVQLTPADYQMCATVNPGPLLPNTKPVLYPQNSTLASWGYGTEQFDGWPPRRFRGDNSAKVSFVAPQHIAKACGVPDNPEYPEEACEDGSGIVLPNPCTFPSDDDFARLACHELAHENGWAGNHPR